jgi:hypothetical protein
MSGSMARASSKSPEDRFDIHNRRLVVERMQRRAALCAISNFDFPCVVIVGERVTVTINRQPKNICQLSIILFDLDRISRR